MTSVISAANGTYRENPSTLKTSLDQYPPEDFAALLQPKALSSGTATSDAGRAPLAEYQGRQLSTSDLMKIIRSEAIHISELPEEQYQVYVKSQEYQLAAMKRGLEDQYRLHHSSDSSSNPRTQPYAKVVLDGKVVATIDNQGVLTGLDPRVTSLGARLPTSLNGTYGPDLARKWADTVARLVGGNVVKAETALTQSEFSALPYYDARAAPIDYEAMKNDPEYVQLQEKNESLGSLKQKRNEYLQKQIVATGITV